MLANELLELTKRVCKQKAETQTLELKSAHVDCPKRLYDTLSSFSNQDSGGILLFGVDESAGYQVVGVYDPQDLQKKVTEQCNQMEPKVRAAFTLAEWQEGVWVCSAEIPGLDLSERPCYYQGAGRIKGSFLRVGDADLPIMFQIPAAVTAIPTGWKNRFYGRAGESLVDLSQEKIDRIRGERRSDWSREIINDVSLSHLDTNAIAIARTNYRERLSNAANPNAVEEFDKMDDYQFLSKVKLIRNGEITKAAFLLLGNGDYSDFFEVPPQIMWRLYDHRGNTIDHEIFDIPFLCAVDSVYKKIRNLTYRYMPNQLSLFPTETQQYDSWLLRELINNCIAHQDYTAGRRIYIDEFEDHIVISNAGQFLPGNIKPVLEPAYAPPYYRNPLLAQAMVHFKMIDTASMGIRRVYSIQKEKLFPMPDYDLSRHNQVRVTVYGKVLNENYTKILFENPDMDLDTVYLLDKVQKGESISRSEATELRKLGLIEGKIPKLFISATVAEALDQKAQYIKNKGFDDQYYKQLIIDYLNKWGKGKKSDFEKLLFDKLPDSLTATQKNNKLRNLLSSLRICGIIETDSENHQRSNWVLTKK